MGNVLIAIDIETVAYPATQEDLEGWRKDYEPPSNYKNPEAIDRHRLKAEKEWLERRKFRLGGSRPISAALCIVADEGPLNVDCKSSNNSDDVANFVADYLNSFDSYKICGFNVKGFDWPMLCVAFHLAGQKLRMPPRRHDFVDLFDWPFERKYGLKELGGIFGLDVPDMDGSRVGQLHEEGRWEDIESYNRQDVTLTAELALAAKRIYGL